MTFIPGNPRFGRIIGPKFPPRWSLVLWACLLAVPAQAQREIPTDVQVKSAYLYNFGKFVRWQLKEDAGPVPLEICVLGRDPFGAVLDSTVAGQSIGGRKVTIKRFLTLQDDSQCGILFVSSSEEYRLSAVLAVARRSAVLTVSDISHFTERGGIIGFVSQQGRIRFEVNRSEAEQSHIALDSELLKVASKVIYGANPQP